MPSTVTLPRSGVISVYSMRMVVVLPAPLGPSSPVIWPSWAVKLTPSTAVTFPVLVLKDLCRSLAMIIRSCPLKVAGVRCAAHGSQPLKLVKGGT